MKIIAISQDIDGVDWNNATSILEDEARKVYQYFLDGIVREIYFTDDQDAVLILECRDKAEAVELLNELPLVKQKYICFQVNELKPYNGFSRILSRSSEF